MACVGLGDRRRALRDDAAGEDADAALRSQRRGVDPELRGELLVERQQPRLRHGRPLPRHVQPIELAREGVVKGEQRIGGDTHVLRG